MLEQALKTQLQELLERLRQPVQIVATLGDDQTSAEMQRFLTGLDGLHPLLSLRLDGQARRRPSFQVTRPGHDDGVHFAAVPLGHEFSSLALALLHVGGHPPRTDPALLEQVRALPAGAPVELETWMSLSCHNCPEVVQALNLMAALNPRLRHTAIDGAAFADEGQARGIMAFPTVMHGDQVLASGRQEFGQLLAALQAKLDTGAAAREAERLSALPSFDMLIVGGGPAGVAAAVYAARKGIRTGVVADRLGGQTLDTLGIENYPSVSHTEGPQFAAALAEQLRTNEVQTIVGPRVSAVTPAPEPGEDIELTLDGGATLHTRSLVLATGARWRKLGVPGEAEYANKGVAYCPHCDGPLFKGRDVAVVGGGNSGVEAAIDLAGIVRHVSVVEFAGELKADAVLVAKLRSLPNVRVHLNARTTEISGDGERVTGMVFEDRTSSERTQLPLAGVFVQIGLVPNTEFLKGTLELNRFGEIIVDDRGATSQPGIFAAGDATTVPYKQIVIAAGEGAKAALSAFDHLMRLPASRSGSQAAAERHTEPA